VRTRDNLRLASDEALFHFLFQFDADGAKMQIRIGDA
jgi:hypothetical protein